MRSGRRRSTVYLLVHERNVMEGGNSLRRSKEIGVFSSRHTAEEARDKVVREEGFRDFPDGFQIVVVPVGVPSEEGYVTYYG